MSPALPGQVAVGTKLPGRAQPSAGHQEALHKKWVVVQAGKQEWGLAAGGVKREGAPPRAAGLRAVWGSALPSRARTAQPARCHDR